MRNIYDQYTQPENKLTHALVSSLAEDKKLLFKFIRWVTNSTPPKNIEIVEQRLPGDKEYSEDEAERLGLPDAWVYDDAGWSLLVESKVSSFLTTDQLRRHYKTAQRRGFDNVTVLAIDMELPRRKLPDFVIAKRWSDIYTWLQKQGKYSDWAIRTYRFMEVAESKWPVDGYLKEGTLTVFTGIPFDRNNPYNYPEAKRVIKLLMEELRKNSTFAKKLDIDLKAAGRSAITGASHNSVWDYLALKKAKNANSFTDYPHFTVSIQKEHVYVLVTMPNSIKREFKHNLLDGGFEEFEKIFSKVSEKLSTIANRVDGAIPWVDVIQRHYKSQRSVPEVDAKLSFDLRTAFPEEGSKVKHQPLWLNATYDAITKKKANTQLAVGIIFKYDKCVKLHSPDIIKEFCNTWIACKPFVKGLIK